MTADQATRLIVAVAQLVGILIWPALIVFVVVRFRSSLADFFGNIGEISVKALGAEVTAKRQEAAAAIGAAVGAREVTEASPEASIDPREVADALPSVRAQRRMEGCARLVGG